MVVSGKTHCIPDEEDRDTSLLRILASVAAESRHDPRGTVKDRSCVADYKLRGEYPVDLNVVKTPVHVVNRVPTEIQVLTGKKKKRSSSVFTDNEATLRHRTKKRRKLMEINHRNGTEPESRTSVGADMLVQLKSSQTYPSAATTMRFCSPTMDSLLPPGTPLPAPASLARFHPLATPPTSLIGGQKRIQPLSVQLMSYSEFVGGNLESNG